MARQRRGQQRAAGAAERKPTSTGSVSRSQAVSTFGIGSIYELRRYSGGSESLHSVMIAGLEWWNAGDMSTIREPVLERSLGVRYFKLPPSEENFERTDGKSYVPAVRFPRWLVCSKCNRLGRVPDEFEDLGNAGPRCRAGGCGGRGMPSRLIVACQHPSDSPDEDSQPGHIDDFPWVWWAFSLQDAPCPAPQLKLESTGETAGLAGLVVRCYCERCRGKVGRSLEGVFRNEALSRLRCYANRPWLDDSSPEGCARRIRALLRGASNVYFPVTVSAISIPPFSRNLFQVIQHRGDSLVPSVGKFDMKVLVEMARNAIPELQQTREDGAEEYIHTDAQIGSVLRTLAEGRDVPRIESERDQRSRERVAILEGRPEEEGPRSEFVAESAPRDDLPGELRDFFARLVMVHRLREVRALRGFCRVAPPLGGDAFQTRCSPLSRRGRDWLPAIVVRGEGVFLELDGARVREWERRHHVRERQEMLGRNYTEACEKRGHRPSPEDLPTARRVLVHTLSHLIMKQLSLECGYSSASLRERLYVRDDGGRDELGVLIYTATTGADGTNGGLVRQGSPERFVDVFLGALEGAGWCSSDPLCIECRGQGIDALNLAACHACCLVSETSCELRNTLLDRGFLIGTPERPDVGYFSELTGRAI
jgi:hypothetical protein